MLLFDIYTYQFRPKDFAYQASLFDEEYLSPERAMENKNSIFEDVIKEKQLMHRGKQLRTQFKFIKDDILVFRVATQKNIRIEENFQKRDANNEPSVCVIVNNHENVQRIAIEQNTRAFANTAAVSNLHLVP